MTPATVLAESPAIDVRYDAFSRSDGPEIFGAITHANQVWHPDRFDVESIHAEARETFARLVRRANATPAPISGKSLLLLGEAGSGKTHLMRAFRNHVHAEGSGYFVYMQMTTRQESYSRYILSSVIHALEHPYCQPHKATGLDRLALGLIDAIAGVSSEEARQLQGGELDHVAVARLVHQLADTAVGKPQFQGIDLDVIRGVLYLLCPDNRIRSRVVKWLRCEDLGRFDLELVGDLVPRPHDHMPLNTVIDLGRLMSAVHDAALIICADQIEEMFDLVESAPGGAFRRMIDAMIEVNSSIPTSIVVLACLDDYFVKGRESLTKAKLDRLEHDPPAHRLSARRSESEIAAIVELRLETLFEAFDLTIDPDRPTFPYTHEYLKSLSGLPTREVLNHCRRQQELAFRGEPLDTAPNGSTGIGTTIVPALNSPLQQHWNDFHSARSSPSLDDEAELAKLLASAIDFASVEMPHPVHFGVECDGRMVPVQVHRANNEVDSVLVAICDRSAQGGGLKRQIDEVAKRSGEFPAVFVRSSPYPTSPTTAVMKRLAELISPKGNARRVVVEAGDWKIMSAFQEFRQIHSQDSQFVAWQRQQLPLTSLASLRHILALDRLTIPSPQPITPRPLPPDAAKKPSNPDVLQTGSPLLAMTGSFRLGVTRAVIPAPVLIEPSELRQHAAFLGGSGSGKTTAALVIIEQLLLQGVPAILVDRKGDLSRYADPEAWKTTNTAAETASRIGTLRERIDVSLYTPGNARGRAMTIPIMPADFAQLPAAERQQFAGYAAAALGGMMGYKSTSTDPRPAILGKAIEVLAAQSAASVTVRAIQKLIEEQDESLLMAVGGFEAKHYKKLSENLLTLLLQRQSLLESGGESLDFDEMIANRTPDKSRLTIINTQFLGDSGAVDFWLSQFLVAAGRWAAKHPSNLLQAVLLFDEADQYLPATRQPATKAPMENLLKRARSAGIGLFLATQSPGDFDYKCRDQIRLWLMGRVKEPTAIAKLKPMLESSKLDASSKLPSQGTGQFFLVRESEVVPIQTDRSLISTQQLSEERILQICS